MKQVTDKNHQYNKNDIHLELEKASEKYHIVGAWIAVFFDPIFAFTDYINIPDNWLNILAIRIFVALTTLSLLFIHKKFKIPSYVIVLIPFILISLQNAYTFQFIDNAHTVGHTLNYVALFIAASLFILWKWHYSVLIVIMSGILTAISVSLNTELHLDVFLVEGGVLLFMVSTLSIILIHARYTLTVKEIISRLKLKESNKKLAVQTQKTEEKNKNITESITYAKRIQNSILGHTDSIQKIFPKSFILFKPKDILSGDFYFSYEYNSKKIIVAADCTGHGVPAALMTVLGTNALKEIIEQQNIFEPGEILTQLDIKIKQAFKNDDSSYSINDGMDICVVVLHENKRIEFSGAMNSLFLVRKNGENERIKGNRKSIGGQDQEIIHFDTKEINTKEGDRFYIYSDGFQDQYGGPNFKKYMSKRFRKTLEETAVYSINKQNILINESLTKWQKKEDQTDDILLIGIEI